MSSFIGLFLLVWFAFLLYVGFFILAFYFLFPHFETGECLLGFLLQCWVKGGWKHSKACLLQAKKKRNRVIVFSDFVAVYTFLMLCLANDSSGHSARPFQHACFLREDLCCLFLSHYMSFFFFTFYCCSVYVFFFIISCLLYVIEAWAYQGILSKYFVQDACHAEVLLFLSLSFSFFLFWLMVLKLKSC